jgi:shikimate dehydrogenase
MCEQIISGILVTAAGGRIAMRVILIGYRGTGKTTIGRSLARELDLPFIDTDAQIEAREGRSIREIFEREGEHYFRNIEREVIQGLPRQEAVISAGGGAILDPANVESLRADSTMILLSADPDTIVRRIQKSRRPPLTRLPLAEEVRHLMQVRGPYYRNAADYCLDTSTKEIPVTVNTILHLLRGDDIPYQEVHHILRDIPPLMPEDRAIMEEGFIEGCPLRICALIGNPVAHSRSPLLFNALFGHYRLPYRYIRMASPSVDILLKLARIRNFRGLSVTIPHKRAVLSYLDEVDPVAEQIDAVNTIVFCGGKSYGYNTDWMGIRHPLVYLQGSRVVVLGAGGAAAAAVYACLDLNMQVTVLNRTPERALALARRFGCDAAPLTDFPRLESDLVINATPVGMEPDTHSPLPGEWLRNEMTIFDLVYTPPRTPLLREAQKRGCPTISGIEMFMHQAREQFHLFTGILPPESLIEEMIS